MRRLIVIVSIIWVICSATFLCQFNRPKTENEDLFITPVYSVKQPVMISLPAKISGTELILHEIISTRDGKCGLLLENGGLYPVERAHIFIGLGSRSLKFLTGNIAPGYRVMTEEISGLFYDNEPILYCYGTQFLDLYLNK